MTDCLIRSSNNQRIWTESNRFDKGWFYSSNNLQIESNILSLTNIILRIYVKENLIIVFWHLDDISYTVVIVHTSGFRNGVKTIKMYIDAWIAVICSSPLTFNLSKNKLHLILSPFSFHGMASNISRPKTRVYSIFFLLWPMIYNPSFFRFPSCQNVNLL